MAFLEIKRLHKRFGSTEVLKGIDIKVDEGGFLVLVGPSGCGKSTLLNTIAGLESITSGDIHINNRTVNALHPSDRDIAMVFQSYALYPNMNVAQNIAFGLEMRGVPKTQRNQAVQDVAQMLQIDHLLKRKPQQLSGGQRQRVAMGRALVRKPQVFLFDEPLSNLDAKLRVDMRTEIKRLHHQLGTTIVYVTHDQIEAMTLATQIAVLKDGVLQQVGTPDEVYRRPANLFVADFMGSPAMNLISATIQDQGRTLRIAQNEAELTLPIAQEHTALAQYENSPVIVGIRPEDITDPDSADRHSKHIVLRDCLVDVVEPAGADTYVVTQLGHKEIIARMRADSRVSVKQTMPFAFNMEKAVFFDARTEQRITV